jgi:hypothetical protein
MDFMVCLFLQDCPGFPLRLGYVASIRIGQYLVGGPVFSKPLAEF